jgi:hypothetical protein
MNTANRKLVARLAGISAAALVAGSGLLPSVASAESLTTSTKQCLITDAASGITRLVMGDSAASYCLGVFDGAPSYGMTAPTVVFKPNPLENLHVACYGSRADDGLTFYTVVEPDRDAARRTCQDQRDLSHIPTTFVAVEP